MHRGSAWNLLAGILFVVALVGCPSSKPKAERSIETPENGLVKVPPFAEQSPSPSPSTIPRVLLRSLRLPQVAAGQRCPITRRHTITAENARYAVLGRAPAFLFLSEVRPDADGVFHYRDVYRAPSGWWLPYGMWWIERSAKGPILVRGQKLNGSSPVLLQGWGSLVGTVRAINDGHTDVELATGTLIRPTQSLHLTADGWANFPPADIAIKGPGCYGFQVDGTTFSYSIVVQFAP